MEAMGRDFLNQDGQGEILKWKMRKNGKKMVIRKPVDKVHFQNSMDNVCGRVNTRRMNEEKVWAWRKSFELMETLFGP